MAHTLLYTMGYNAPEARLLPENFDWKDQSVLDAALKQITDKLRPWTFDFHVAQNDGSVFGSGSHDKTGRHCQVKDPNGKLDVTKHAGFWLRDGAGNLTKAFQHLCWDVPQCRDDATANLERYFGRDDQGSRCQWLASLKKEF